MNHTSSQHVRPDGFTLVELIVAVGLMSLLMLLINQIFNDTFRAVGLGVQTGDIVANHRALSEQVEADAQDMLGPQNQGVLIILNKRVTRGGTGVVMPDPNRGARLDTINQVVRSDQLIFFRHADGMGDSTQKLEMFTPQNNGEFTGNPSVDAATARIWYGHLDLTSDIGVPPATADSLVNTTSGDMADGWRWLLGRQALLLDEVDLAGTANIRGVTWDSAVSGITTDDGAGGNVISPATDRQLYTSLCDTSEWGLATTTAAPDSNGSDGKEDVGASDRYIIRHGASVDTDFLLSDDLANATYQDNAYKLTFGEQRLVTNPFPKPLAGTDPTEHDFLFGWQIAQQHPYLMANVSDFIVEYAADADNDGEIDIDSNNNGWPDNGTLGSPIQIAWYGNYDDALNQWIYPGNPANPDAGGSSFDFTDAGSWTDVYNPVDTSLPAALINADLTHVWRHDDNNTNPMGDPGASKWPLLIRIRYRMHDQRGDLMTSQYDTGTAQYEPVAGKWFEVIIPVNRP